MTQRNRKPLTFSTLFRRRVEADFDGGRLTSDAGGLLLREVDRRLGPTDRPAEHPKPPYHHNPICA